MVAIGALILAVLFFSAGCLVKEKRGDAVLMYLCFFTAGYMAYEYLSRIAS